MAIPVSYPPYIFPEYISCYFDFDRRISFTAETAQVYSLNTKQYATFRLEIPTNPDAPEDDALFAKKRIRRLLKQGYVPALDGTEITLVHPSRAAFIDPFFCSCDNRSNAQQLIDSCERIMKCCKNIIYEKISLSSGDESTCRMSTSTDTEDAFSLQEQPDPSLSFLSECLYRITKNDFEGALAAIEQAIARQDHPRGYTAALLKQLQAQCCCFLMNNDKAASIYVELASHSSEKKLFFLEKALHCCPQELSLYARLAEICAGEKEMHLYLYAIKNLTRTKPAVAQKYYEKAQEVFPKEPLIHFARLSCLQKEQQAEKRIIYKRLAAHFKAASNDTLHLFYLSKTIFSSPEDFLEYVLAIKQDFHNPVVNAEKEKSVLALIDAFLANNAYDQAEEAIKKALNEAVRSVEILKRLLIIFAERKKREIESLSSQVSLLKMQ